MLRMAPILLPRILDGGRPNIDALGITYVVASILYTLVLAGELYVLYCRRSAFCIRIRSLEVIFTSVTMLHVYLVLVLLVYPLNGRFPCSAEFWIMSVFLPSGMAIFQGTLYSLLVQSSLLTTNSRKRKSIEGLRKPTPNAQGLPRRRSKAANHLYTARSMAGMVGPQRGRQGVRRHLRWDGNIRKPTPDPAMLNPFRLPPADCSRSSLRSYSSLALGASTPLMDHLAPLWTRYSVAGAASGKLMNDMFGNSN